MSHLLHSKMCSIKSAFLPFCYFLIVFYFLLNLSHDAIGAPNCAHKNSRLCFALSRIPSLQGRSVFIQDVKAFLDNSNPLVQTSSFCVRALPFPAMAANKTGCYRTSFTSISISQCSPKIINFSLPAHSIFYLVYFSSFLIILFPDDRRQILSRSFHILCRSVKIPLAH